MPRLTLCSRCGRPVPDGARFCPECGSPVSSISTGPSEAATRPATPSHRPPSSGAHFASTAGEFIPGQVLAGRYRVIGLLGRGGMGEVYRADDLKLGQAVALKFLPASLAHRADLMERLNGEVRNARQVSHPNVCRVYDVGEIDGRPFLTMEYVDGEDLGTLLRRIGRLPRAKADQVGRQMCAGLAAAHDRGVIHRDLKPSNVMLDGDGRVRITDFGLAVRGEENAPGEVAGTAAYMSPEQFEGRPATVQSDLYSLGLILYEIHTGKRALEADSFEQWRLQHREVTPSSPSAVEHDVDEAVSRAILRCLEKDPARRPASALQLAASLPGGDPLAAALAAGETPSPQLVATAGGQGAASPGLAWSLLGGSLMLLATALVMAPYASDLGLAPVRLNRPVLEERAREIRTRLGYTDPAHDAYGWFRRDYAALHYAAAHEVSTEWRRHAFRERGAPSLFELRESPRWLSPRDDRGPPGDTDPPFNTAGMTRCVLDLDGRLRLFQAVPPSVEPAADSSAASAALDWSVPFAAAGLETSHFTPVAPRRVPPTAFDTRVEWVRQGAASPLDSLRVAAAGWRGRVVNFEVLGPWDDPDRSGGRPKPVTVAIGDWVGGILWVVGLIAAALIAWRHVRSGRGDRRGAVRLLHFVAALSVFAWLFRHHPVGDLGAEIQMVADAIARAYLNGVWLAIFYLAIEPIVRRRTPEQLIGWARLLEGRWSDPRVGRDTLVGAIAGLVMALLFSVSNALPAWVPFAHQTPIPPNRLMMRGMGGFLSETLGTAAQALEVSLMILLLYFLLRTFLRRPALAAVVLGLVIASASLGGENPVLEFPVAFAIAAIVAFTLVRFGLLAVAIASFISWYARPVPLSFDPGSILFYGSVATVGLVLVMVLVGFRVSLGGRPVLNLGLDEEAT